MRAIHGAVAHQASRQVEHLICLFSTFLLACLLSLSSHSVPLRVLIGHSCLMHLNYENALEQYSRAWADAPNDPQIHLFLGMVSFSVCAMLCLGSIAGTWSCRYHLLATRNAQAKW